MLTGMHTLVNYVSCRINWVSRKEFTDAEILVIVFFILFQNSVSAALEVAQVIVTYLST